MERVARVRNPLANLKGKGISSDCFEGVVEERESWLIIHRLGGIRESPDHRPIWFGVYALRNRHKLSHYTNTVLCNFGTSEDNLNIEGSGAKT